MPRTTTTSSGPALVWVGSSITESGVSTFNYIPLGWCEVSPEIAVEAAHARMFNALGGVQVEYYNFIQGAEGQIACTFTKWDDSLLSALKHYFVTQIPVARMSVPYNRWGVCVAIFMPVAYSVNTNKDVMWPHPSVMLFPTCRVAEVREHDMTTGPSRVTVVFHAMRSHTQVRAPQGLDDTGGFGLGSMALGGYGGMGGNIQGSPWGFMELVDGVGPDMHSIAVQMWNILSASHVFG